MKTIFKIIKQEKHDRLVYVHYNELGMITGLNFHQGMETLYMEYAESDDRIMEIFNELLANVKCETTSKYLINKAIEDYEIKYIFNE